MYVSITLFLDHIFKTRNQQPKITCIININYITVINILFISLYLFEDHNIRLLNKYSCTVGAMFKQKCFSNK